MFTALPPSAQDFYNQILVQSIIALKMNTFLDNFDAARFNVDGIDRSTEFNGGQSAYFFDWFSKHHDRLWEAYSHLGSDSSKRLYLYLIAFRLAGHFSVRLPVDFLGKTAEQAEFEKIAACTPSQISSSSLLGGLKHFDFEFKGARYLVDCLGLDYYLVRGQYFYDKDGVRVAPASGDVVIDGGACTGDTAAVFSNAVGAAGHVFCFDPVADHIAVVEHNRKQFPHANVTMLPFGLSDKNVDAPPILLQQCAPGFSSGNNLVPLRHLDYLVNQKELPKFQYLKLDVEGAELETLRGARESIRRFRPKLAISLYHKPNDLFDLILYVKTNFPFYACFVNHYTIHMEETVLYCLER